jgi:hypothetical protein
LQEEATGNTEGSAVYADHPEHGMDIVGGD